VIAAFLLTSILCQPTSGTPEPSEGEEEAAFGAMEPGTGGVVDPAAPLKVKALSAILVDGRSGLVLWEKNANQRRPMASTTKIMTTTLLLEMTRPEEIVTASKTAAATRYANLHLRPGETLSMRDLLFAIMLRSANDGCVAAAEHVAGSEAGFVQMMNEKAKEVGALDTRFANSNGLFHPQHYSTAADLARMTVYAIRNPQFNVLCGTPTRSIARSMATKDVSLRNHNKLLLRYAGADGVKTGYVRQSGRCLVASATRADAGQPWRLIAVVLNSADTYGDCSALLNYGFRNFQPASFARRDEQVGMAYVRNGVPAEIPAVAREDIYAVIPRGSSAPRERRLTLAKLTAPVSRDAPVGTLAGVIDGKVVASAPLYAGAQAEPGVAPSMGRVGGLCAAAWMIVAWGPRYARALAKGPRRRRRRISPRRRVPDQRRSRLRGRARDYPAWDEG
jgi:D-alanyl-D-alanine carboxypeptidase (penicillin-binding protein 5/6)